MARSHKWPSVRAREAAERRHKCERARAENLELGTKWERAWAEYFRLVVAEAVCPICGCSLIEPCSLDSLSVWTPIGFIHAACV
jgi:hypothetical protein